MKENRIRSCLLLSIDKEIKATQLGKTQFKINSTTVSQLSKQYDSPLVDFINPVVSSAIYTSDNMVRMGNILYKSKTLNFKTFRKKRSQCLNLYYLKGKNAFKKKSISNKSKKENQEAYYSPSEVLSFKTHLMNESIIYLNTIAREINPKSKLSNDSLNVDNDNDDMLASSKNLRKQKKYTDNIYYEKNLSKKRQKKSLFVDNHNANNYKPKNNKYNRENSYNENSSDCSSTKEELIKFNVQLHSMNDDSNIEEN